MKNTFLIILILFTTKTAYTQITTFNSENNKVGLKDSVTGKIIVEAIYDHISWGDTSAKFTPVVINGKCTFLNRNFKPISEPNFDKVRYFTNNLSPVCINNKWGYIDTNANLVIKPQFDFADDFLTEKAWIFNKDKNGLDNWGMIDMKGNFIVEPKYTFLSYCFKYRFYLVSKGGEYKYFKKNKSSPDSIKAFVNAKWGIIDIDGNELSGIKYDYIDDGSIYMGGGGSFPKWRQFGSKWGYEINAEFELIDGMFCSYPSELIVCENNKWGLINSAGKEIVPLKYDRISCLYNGLSQIKTQGLYGFIDSNGKEVIPADYEEASYFDDTGLTRVKKNNKYGFINRKGKKVIDFIYEDSHYTFANNIIWVKKDDKIGIIDTIGKEITPFKYNYVGDLSSDKILVNIDGTYNADKKITGGKFGFINPQGQEIIPLKYDYASNFENDLAVVAIKGKYGFIDKSGKLVIPLKYEWADTFSDETAQVKLKGRIYYIDKTGKIKY